MRVQDINIRLRLRMIFTVDNYISSKAIADSLRVWFAIPLSRVTLSNVLRVAQVLMNEIRR